MAMIADYPLAGRPTKSMAVMERDAALVRVSRVRRWMIVGAAGLTAGVAALVSSIAPGHTLKSSVQPRSLRAARPSAQPATSNSTTKLPPLASPGDLGLQGPSSAPQSAPSSSQVTPDPSQSSLAHSQSSPDPSQSASSPAQVAPAPSPAPAPVVSGGS